ncbi:tumor necrosis factor receptor superfamily member 4 [Pelobates cultripes]|nr:tumor necrosis factor receptor superfamily member 4 [Pelobates cultripes]
MAVISVTIYLVFLTTTTWALCQPNQYSTRLTSGKEICCFYCAAGEAVKQPCKSNNSNSICVTCPEGYYNREKTKSECSPCFYCNTKLGSIEKKACTKSAQAECICPNGSISKNERHTACECPKGKQIVKEECVQCPVGHFSDKENSICRPWTNCSARGDVVQVAGSSTSDVICSKTKIQPEPVTTKFSNLQTSRIFLNNLKTISANQHTVTREDKKNNDVYNNNNTGSGNLMTWGTLSLILVGVTLLSLSAGFIITMIIQMKPKKMNNILRSRKCRHPVQEQEKEQSSASESSLVKQCSESA